jgi:ABC-type Zn2+ transport system substrate-binding protein/surface adhesin
VGYVIAKNQDDLEKMRMYAVVIRKFQRRLNIAISDFPEIGVCGFEEDFENKEEDDDSKLAVYDPWSRKSLGEPNDDENEDEDEGDEEDDNHQGLYRR